MGSAGFTIAEILTNGKEIEVELLDDQNIGTGAFVTLHCDVLKLKADPRAFDVPAPPNQLNGVLIILVTKAFNLSLPKEKAECFVKVKYGSQEFQTGMVTDYPGIDCLNPVYDMAFHIPITREIAGKGYSDINFELWNGGYTIKKPYKLGSIEVTHKTLMEAKENTITETRSIVAGGPLLQYQVSLKATDEVAQKLVKSGNLRGISLNSVVTESTPLIESKPSVKKLRVTMIGGQGFKVKKKRFKKDDIPDLYCNIKFGTSPQIWRTKTIKDSTCPNWNESAVYNFVNEKQSISADVYDANRRNDDRFVGSFCVTIGTVLLNSGHVEVPVKHEGTTTVGYVKLSCELE